MAAPAPTDSDKPRDRGPDGEKIVSMEYYDLLNVRGDATDADLKKAYRKLALKYHPDRNAGDEQAAEMFKSVGEAYQVLSDSNLRAAYNKHGKKQGHAPGEGGLDEASAMFSQMFGGERFHDWVGEIALAKEFTRAMEVTMTDEERAELEKEAAAAAGGPKPAASTTTTPAAPANIAATAHVHEEPAVTGQAPAATSSYATSSVKTSATPSASTSGTSTPTTVGSDAAKAGGAAAAATADGATTPKTATSTKSGKLTAEQKKQMEALDEERAKEKEERVKMLVKKLIERLRPFVQATRPGEQGDPETEAFEKRMRLEADDLRLESFGVEMCKLIGSVYVTKATTFLRLHRKGPWSNVLGIPGWWSRVREKGTTIKEGWSFLTSTLDVQSAMEEAAKRQEKGEVPEEEAKELETDLMGKILLVSWRGTRFEVANILRTVCDGVLSKHDLATGAIDKHVTDTDLINRAKGMLIIGAIMQAVVPDESDEERRELERLVASAAAKTSSKKRKAAKKEGAHAEKATPAATTASATPPPSATATA